MDYPENLVLVQVMALVEDEETANPIVVLHDQKGNRLLPIWIGDPEARAIGVVLHHMKTPRPLTHKLLVNTIKDMGGQLSRVVIDRISRHTYFASIYVFANEKEVKIDARPSDSIAIALEAETPIFVEKEVMEKAAQPNPLGEISMAREKGNLKTFKIEDFKEEDAKKLKELLDRAREREKLS